ncbi:MAG: DUF2971 domain-containing protein, partial [Planctomycetota bacterium]
NPMCLSDVNEFTLGWKSLLTTLGLDDPWKSCGYIGSFAAVGCLSKSPRILSQWRGYAADATGLAIGINPHVFATTDCELRECVYTEAEHAQVIKKLASQYGDYVQELIDEKESDRFFAGINEDERFFLLTCELLRLKHSAFEQEREVRVIKRINSPSDWSYRVRDGLAIPYLNLDLAALGTDSVMGGFGFQNYLFKEIWYGPKCNYRNRVVFDTLIPRFSPGLVFDCGYS